MYIHHILHITYTTYCTYLYHGPQFTFHTFQISMIVKNMNYIDIQHISHDLSISDQHEYKKHELHRHATYYLCKQRMMHMIYVDTSHIAYHIYHILHTPLPRFIFQIFQISMIIKNMNQIDIQHIARELSTYTTMIHIAHYLCTLTTYCT